MILASRSCLLEAQDAAAPPVLMLGISASAVSAVTGPPFRTMNVATSDENARVGVPLGAWDVYHLTSPGGLTFVTMVHFGERSAGDQEPVATVVDSLILIPSSHWPVSQILDEQAGIAVLCIEGCDVIRTTDHIGRESLLLEPQGAFPGRSVLFFEGDSGTAKWQSVSTLDSPASRAYALSLADFENHHADLRWEVVGIWRPRVGTPPVIQASKEKKPRSLKDHLLKPF